MYVYVCVGGGGGEWGVKSSKTLKFIKKRLYNGRLQCSVVKCIKFFNHQSLHSPLYNWYSLSTSRYTVLPRLSVPRLSETSIIRTWSLFKKYDVLTKIADSATEQSTCVCVSYVHVQCRHTVVRHRVQCEL